MAITCKPGVVLMPLAPAGVRLLEAIRQAARTLNLDVVITSGRDGQHNGPNDPHYSGEALDLRTHDFTPEQKHALLREIMLELQTAANDAPLETSGGLATLRFFGFLESPGTPIEHLHVQRRNGTTYTLNDYLAA